MRSARGTVPETEIDPRRYLPGTENRIRGALEDADRTGQGKRSQGPVRKPAARLKLVGMKMEADRGSDGQLIRRSSNGNGAKAHETPRQGQFAMAGETEEPRHAARR